MPVTIRKIESRDAARWRVLWEGYCQFYERAPNEPVARHTWARLMDAASPVQGIVAEDEQAGVIGIANYMLHESTAALAPVCYLQDLFVDPAQRAVGVGRQLIDWLVEQMKSQGWARLYWNTR